jgi:hypothetical protein
MPTRIERACVERERVLAADRNADSQVREFQNLGSRTKLSALPATGGVAFLLKYAR